MSSADVENALFGFVAKNPGDKRYFCHVFVLRKQRHAEEVQAIMSKAFRLAFTEDRSLKAGMSAAVPPAKPALPAGALVQAPPTSHGPGAAAGGARPPAAPVDGRNWARNNPLQGIPVPQQRQRRIMIHPGSARSAATAAEMEPDHGAWFQAGIPREIAMEVLAMSEDGAFIVRDSQSQPGNFALTMRGNSLMNHFIIRQTPRGLVLGLDEDRQPPFPTLNELIVHYSRHKGILPCTLDLDHDNKLCTEEAQLAGDLDSFVDCDYQSLKQLGLG